MADKFLEIAFTDSVCKAQAHYYGKAQQAHRSAEGDALTEDEMAFIRARDSAYASWASSAPLCAAGFGSGVVACVAFALLGALGVLG